MRRPLRTLALTAAALLLATTWSAAPTTAQDSAAWGIMQFTMLGQPGDWVFIYHKLSEPTHFVIYDVEYNFGSTATDGSPFAALWGFPIAARDGSGEQPMNSMFTQLRLYDKPEGGLLRRDANGTSWASSTGLITGFTMLAGSTAAWNLTVTITLDETGPTVGPSFVSTGSNMTRWSAAETYPAEPLAPYLGVLDFEVPLTTSGWTHFQLYRRQIEPLGVRAYSVEFPNHTYRKVDLRAGVGDEEAGYRGFTSGYPAAIGVPQDTSGTFRAHIARAETTADLRMVLVHLPMDPDDLPWELQPSPYIQQEAFR